jgi:hypothetical protein
VSDEAPVRQGFNPTWLTVGAIVLTGVISGSVNTALNSRDAEDSRAFRIQQEKWNAAMERRMSDADLTTGKAIVALSKDVEVANKTLASIQQALMVRPAQLSSHTP